MIVHILLFMIGFLFFATSLLTKDKMFETSGSYSSYWTGIVLGLFLIAAALLF